jgi:hypothetical protein
MGGKTVSEETIPDAAPTEEDVNTTPPNPPAKDGNSGSWTMPEPVFRKTSGYLPQGFEKRYSQDEIKSSTDDYDSTAEMPTPELAADIEPQPEIPDLLEEGSAMSQSPVAVPRKSSAAKVIFTILGLLLALALVVVFIAVVYYFFLMPSSDSTF